MTYLFYFYLRKYGGEGRTTSRFLCSKFITKLQGHPLDFKEKERIHEFTDNLSSGKKLFLYPLVYGNLNKEAVAVSEKNQGNLLRIFLKKLRI